MTVVAPVYEAIGEDTQKLGDFEFFALPSVGDMIKSTDVAPTMLDFYCVEYVEQRPVKLPRGKVTADDQPAVAVYVKLVSREPL